MYTKICALLLILGIHVIGFAQSPIPQNKKEVIDTTYSDTLNYFISTNDGGQFIGKILSKNDREFYVETRDKGKIYIPKYAISEIKPATESNKMNGNLFSPNPHPSRYYYAPSAFPVEKGSGYINCTYYLLYQAQYGLTDNISIGGTMTVLGMPALFNAKWSQKIAPKLHVSVGGQIGKTWWSNDGAGLGIGFMNVTVGSEESNLTVNIGKGFYGSKSINIVSGSGIQRISKKLSLIVEGWFFLQPNFDPIFFGGPGFRLYAGKKATWDFGFLDMSYKEQYWGYDGLGQPKLYTKGHDFFPIPFISATYRI